MRPWAPTITCTLMECQCLRLRYMCSVARGDRSATWVQSMAPTVRGNPAILTKSAIALFRRCSWVGLMMWWDMRLRIAGTTWCTHLLMLVCDIPATTPLVRWNDPLARKCSVASTLTSGCTACERCVWLVISSCRSVESEDAIHLRIPHAKDVHARSVYPLPCPPPSTRLCTH